jgi:hypothetical protein
MIVVIEVEVVVEDEEELKRVLMTLFTIHQPLNCNNKSKKGPRQETHGVGAKGGGCTSVGPCGEWPVGTLACQCPVGRNPNLD